MRLRRAGGVSARRLFAGVKAAGAHKCLQWRKWLSESLGAQLAFSAL